ncbi:regulatory protein [Streptomyces sp. AA4]|nr:regulatory protein [Streptomyces sp. AA4]
MTNYDALIVSALVEAQLPSGPRRAAGPCPLRSMRSASVAVGDGARLAAAVSLVLASAKVDDHVADRDGAFARRPVAGAARLVARRWAAQGGRTGAGIGFDTAVLTEAVGRQGELERALRAGDSPLLATEPAELASSAAFAQTAVLAGRLGNRAPLAEAGRLFGRVAHLLDAVEDLAADAASGAWNPLLATGTAVDEAHRLCSDAVLGVELALREAEFADSALVHALLVHELRQAVRRAFGHHHLHGQQPPPGWIGPGPAPQQSPYGPGTGQPGYGRQPGYGAPVPGYGPAGMPGPGGPGGPDGPEPPGEGDPLDGKGGGCWVPRFAVPPERRNFFAGCAIATYMCCSCQYCCRDPYPGPWSGKPHSGGCDGCDCGGCDCDCGCCDGCDCCDC